MAMRALLLTKKIKIVPEFEEDKMREMSEEERERYYREECAEIFARPLTHTELSQVKALEAPVIQEGKFSSPNMAAAMCLACKFAMTGWRNIIGENGEPVDFKGEKDANDVITGATDDDVNALIHSVRQDVYRDVKKASELGDQDFG